MEKQILTPIGIFEKENGTFTPKQAFSKDPKKAAVQFREKEPTENVLSKVELSELFSKQGIDFSSFIHEFNRELTKLDLKEALSRADFKIIQISNALDEVNDSINLYSERLREWFNLYYPELSQQVSSHSSFTKVAVKERPKNSVGGKFNEQDEKELKNFARFVKDSYKARDDLANYLESIMQQNFPNLKAVAGAKVGAELLSAAGSAKRLARLPSSTIQVIGAERALFRHLKEGTKPPKHGIILSHPLLQMAPKHLRGKIARKISAKIAIAIRRDYFEGKFMGKALRKELNEEVQKLRKR